MDKSPEQAWDPYSKDCSLGYCSYYCPQWCFFLFPPPPPPPPSRPLLSPLLIAIIAVVSTVFLLVAYYAILTRYRRRRRASGPGPLSEDQPAAPWHASRQDGLDDTLINKISACQYRAGGGLLLDGTDCSVCLSQFEDGDHIRLLPKCSHPFHLSCVDTWLKSHSTCPLCRASIFPLPTNMLIGMGPVITQTGSQSESESEPEPEPNSRTGHENGAEGRNESNHHDIVEMEEGIRRVIGRSFSMDSTLRRAVTEANVDADAGTGTGTGSSSRWTRALHSVISPVRTKRSRSLRSTLPT